MEVLFLGMECDRCAYELDLRALLTQKLERARITPAGLPARTTSGRMHLVELFGCKEVYVYAMGQEPWLNHVMKIKYTEESNPIVQSNRLIETCHERGIVGRATLR